MVPARATAVVAAPADEVWAALLDLPRHARWIPWTRVEAGPAAVGTRVRAVSGPRATRGGGGLVDEMVVVRHEPPGTGDDDRRTGDERRADDDMRTGDETRTGDGARAGVAVLRKLGPVLLGAATIVVRPLPERPDGRPRTRVTWTEDVFLAGPLPRAVTAALLRPALTLMLRRAMRSAVRDILDATDRR